MLPRDAKARNLQSFIYISAKNDQMFSFERGHMRVEILTMNVFMAIRTRTYTVEYDPRWSVKKKLPSCPAHYYCAPCGANCCNMQAPNMNYSQYFSQTKLDKKPNLTVWLVNLGDPNIHRLRVKTGIRDRRVRPVSFFKGKFYLRRPSRSLKSILVINNNIINNINNN